MRLEYELLGGLRRLEVPWQNTGMGKGVINTKGLRKR